ncbi:hypothetical protein AB0L13_23500 [Saccharopolyspora shandongensis]|uniref:hypothetical protein n=1 Tax=Saccharopolyspora shandongensis TaxID=418495 RepID=UPI00343F6D61
MPTISEQAQQLQALTEEVPTGQAREIAQQLETLQSQVSGILGETSTAAELNQFIGGVMNETNTLAAGLEELRQKITSQAEYHMQG